LTIRTPLPTNTSSSSPSIAVLSDAASHSGMDRSAMARRIGGSADGVRARTASAAASDSASPIELPAAPGRRWRT
jgi:hypothetical protein